MFICMEKINFIIIFFCLDIAKILPTDFGYFGHVWPLPSKRIMPTCGNFDINLYAKNEFDA